MYRSLPWWCVAPAPKGAPTAERCAAVTGVLFHNLRLDDVELARFGLACGATLLLYDGSPFADKGTVLFDYAEAEKMTHFGTSASLLMRQQNLD